MRLLVVLLFLLLIVAHQDFWSWHTHEPLVFGFIPAGLAWHVGISLSAAALGALAVRFCWPTRLDTVERESSPATGRSRRPARDTAPRSPGPAERP